MSIQIMTDGGADVPKVISTNLDLISVPLYIHFQEEQFLSDELEMSTFYRKIRETNELPRSSAPSPSDFYEAYKKVDPNKPIIMLSLSKALSSTYENATIGKNMLLEEEPERQIEVINTKTASCGISLLLYEAQTKIKESYTFEQLVDHLYERVEQATTLFVLKTLENLILGGRLDKVKGTIAKTLNIKLLMRGSEEGAVEVTEKVRGDKKSIRRFVDQIGEYAKNVEDRIITMTHCAAEERANNVLHKILEQHPFKGSFLSEAGPIISTYGGEEALVISFFND